MPTGYEVEMYQHIANIDRSLNRIANCMEAAERRAREQDGPRATTPEDIEQMGQTIQAVRRGLADLEASQQDQAEIWRAAREAKETDLSFPRWLAEQREADRA